MKLVYACDICEYVSNFHYREHRPVVNAQSASCFFDCPGEVRAWDVNPVGWGIPALIMVERDSRVEET